MKVSIVKCEDYNSDRILSAVRRSLGNLDLKINNKSKVLIKPNVLGQYTPETAITTNPKLIEAVVKILKEKECKILIGDSSGFHIDGGTDKALEITGMKSLAERYDLELVNLEKYPVKKIKDDKAVVYKDLEISGIVFDVDLIINMPKLKTHTLMKYTGAVKNLYGCIPGGLKQSLHIVGKDEAGFGQIIVDIFQNIKPKINIMDGIIGLEGNGPGSGGIPKKTGLVIASENAAALDIVASEIIGYNPMEIYTNSYSVQRGLINPSEIKVIGKKPSIPYKRPINASKLPKFILDWIMKRASMKPYAIKKKCIKCGFCRDICPVKAIILKPYPQINDKKCIKCYCCHENCPHDAMDLKGSTLIQIIQKIRHMFTKKN
jgi:uncharacterized protein (DUF362 family)/NAD-dependent dihydropyrimidine dehydrogenase PreA subunit